MLGSDFGREAKSRIERAAHDLGQVGHAVPHRPEQLMQTGKRQMRLGLHASGREHHHAPPSRSPGGVRQQPRLADTRVAANHQRLAARRDLVQHRVQECLLVPATN